MAKFFTEQGLAHGVSSHLNTTGSGGAKMMLRAVPTAVPAKEKTATMKMPAADRILVSATWDGEANVWLAISEDVPGLIVEADSLDALAPMLDDLIPRLLAENKTPHKINGHFSYHIVAHIDRDVERASAA